MRNTLHIRPQANPDRAFTAGPSPTVTTRIAANSANVELYHFMGKDPGGFLSVSGGGVLASSKNPVEAQQFLNFMTSKAGQQVLSDSKALEYSIASEVPSHPSLKPLSELDPPAVDISRLNAPMVIELMQKAGLL